MNTPKNKTIDQRSKINYQRAVKRFDERYFVTPKNWKNTQA